MSIEGKSASGISGQLSRSELLATIKDARVKSQIEQDRDHLPTRLRDFIAAAWPVLKPAEPYKTNWHIDAICEHLEAVSNFEISRLQVWIPPGSMKTVTVSVMWPCWEWTREPGLRYWTGSYQTDLSLGSASMCLNMMESEWYRQRWGDKFSFLSTASHYFTNDQGGSRLSTSPDSKGTGYHGHRIVIDDPLRARDADRDSIAAANQWYDSTIQSRGIPWKDHDHARVLIMQRLHPDDLAAHMLEQEDWEVLCLPERYERKHPYAWVGDPRRDDGELLWPAMRNEKSSNAMAKGMTSHRAAGQLQQRPSSPEGEILKRSDWRFYDSRIRSQEKWDELPKFTMVIQSIDCPLKDRESNDNVAAQVWGIKGADSYLLDVRLGKMNYPLAKRTIKEQALWARRAWPRSRHFLLIENAGYGVELITDLKRELTGTLKISPGQDGDKVMRATTASDALESHNCFLPGFGPPWQPAYDEAKTPDDVVRFISSCASFPNASHDDDVDAWSQMVNWKRAKTTTPMRTHSAHRAGVR